MNIKDAKTCYKNGPWVITLMLAAVLFYAGVILYALVTFIYIWWPKSLYYFLSIASLIAGSKWILNRTLR